MRKNILAQPYYLSRFAILAFLLFTFLFLPIACEQHAGKYREELGPAGNQYIETAEAGREPVENLTEKDLPENLRKLVEVIAPGPKIFNISKDRRGKGFTWDIEVELKKNDAYFDIELWPDGRIHEIDSWTKKYGREQAGRIFDEGNIKEISPSQLSQNVIDVADHFSLGQAITKAFKVKARKGERFFVQFGDSAEAVILSMSPEGQLLAAEEADDMLRPFKPEEKETEDDYALYLDPYKEKFNVRNIIKHIQQVPFKSEKGFRFVVLGDNRSNVELWRTIVKSIKKYKPLFVIDTGDMVSHGYAREFAEYLLPPLDKYADYPFLPVMGNHDRGDDGAQYEYVFGGDSSRTYYFDYGKCRFVVLDNGAQGGYSWQEQLRMADEWLSEVPEYRKFVFMHKPPHEIKKWAYHAMGPSVSEPFVKLMNKHHVEHVFCGHIHAYSTATYQGVNYTVTGGAGAGLHSQYGALGSIHHYVIVDVTPKDVKMRVVRFYPEDN